MRRALAVLLIASSAAAAPAARKSAPRPRPVKAAKQAAAKKPKSAPAPKPAPAETPAPRAEPAPLDEIALFGLGAAVVAQDDGVIVAAVRAGSRADAAGLEPGDQLLRAGEAVSARSQAAARLRAWEPGTRLSLIVRRGTEVRTLETAPVGPARGYARGERDLSEHEKVLASESSARALAESRTAVKAVPALAVPVRADQGLWIRFPKGLPGGLKAGDEVSAEAATGLTVDATLDYLAVPPGSKLRARVLEADDDGETRTVRLVFYALDLKGGGSYSALGHAAAVSGSESAAKVTSGGTFVAPSPLPDAKTRAPEPMLDADARLRVRLLDSLVIDEPPSYWRTGPGLWIKTVEDGGKRLFEVTHVIPGRSADNAGLKVGERLDRIEGRSTENMDFADAIDSLYGPAGSEIEVSVLRGRAQTLKLVRGRKWAGGKAEALPAAYAAR